MPKMRGRRRRTEYSVSQVSRTGLLGQNQEKHCRKSCETLPSVASGGKRGLSRYKSSISALNTRVIVRTEESIKSSDFVNERSCKLWIVV
jgi:hypothetical protein